MNNFVWQPIITNRYFLYSRWWKFSNFLCLVVKKTKSKSLLSSIKLLTNFENPFSTVTLFKDSTAALLSLEMITGNRLWWSCKIITKTACDKYILAHCHCSQWGDNELRTPTNPLSKTGLLLVHGKTESPFAQYLLMSLWGLRTYDSIGLTWRIVTGSNSLWLSM